ncbi:Cytochrome c oxidase subunit 6B [Auxenochlorella protothecoides]|nr:Cytochrome c oxidase subunit 6B [Auxenochlorella protothecoides]KFM23023.1 Cytochrome c oxidase subunit 6B [Auxenochlorella protothecoides]RMZ54157.1 hypothetical protein APUTEX25_005313 [Auxenochlorella protothecoides]|eukprot:RMZ54157.1 hypothetical protein APUTEX25_005313 [Auxenochlorella protothecoides]
MGNVVSYAEEAVVVAEAPEAEEVESPEPEKESVEAEAVEEEEPEKRQITLSTSPVDFRFPITNQSRHCYVAYCEAHRCFQQKGEEDSECQRLAKVYRSICPVEWLEQWNEARENGSW